MNSTIAATCTSTSTTPSPTYPYGVISKAPCPTPQSPLSEDPSSHFPVGCPPEIAGALMLLVQTINGGADEMGSSKRDQEIPRPYSPSDGMDHVKPGKSRSGSEGRWEASSSSSANPPMHSKVGGVYHNSHEQLFPDWQGHVQSHIGGHVSCARFKGSNKQEHYVHPCSTPESAQPRTSSVSVRVENQYHTAETLLQLFQTPPVERGGDKVPTSTMPLRNLEYSEKERHNFPSDGKDHVKTDEGRSQSQGVQISSRPFNHCIVSSSPTTQEPEMSLSSLCSFGSKSGSGSGSMDVSPPSIYSIAAHEAEAVRVRAYLLALLLTLATPPSPE